MALSDFSGPNFIDDWSTDLDQQWPERQQAFAAVVQRIGSWCDNTVPHLRAEAALLELGIGASHLAGAVMDRVDQSPLAGAAYIGLDCESELLDHAATRLSQDPTRLDLRQIDLNSSVWHENIPPVMIAYSLQSIHDLAGIEALTNIYQRLFGLLQPEGLMINADFVVPKTDDSASQRRFPVAVHEDLLARTGFVDFSHTLHGQLACMSARRPPQ